jgi:hypothetical protein
VRSFDRLSDEEIRLLHQVASVSPKRVYDPTETPRITWSGLSPLAQDDAFYGLVQSILSQARDCELFFPHDRKEIELLSLSAKDLIDRQYVRAAAYRISQFGAERYTTGHDMDYASRDMVMNSAAEYRIYRLAKFLENGHQDCLLERVLPSTIGTVCSFFSRSTQEMQTKRADVITKKPRPISSFNLKAEFEIDWLQRPSEIPREVWHDVLKQLSHSDLSRDKYRIMTFSAALIFADGADNQIVQALLAFVTALVMRTAPSPQYHQPFLPDGIRPDQATLKNLAEKSKLGFSRSPEAQLSKHDEEQSYEFQNRTQRAYDKSVSKVIDNFVTQLQV